jgi:site-specific DNA-methyltransferase (adenine-specific)
MNDLALFELDTRPTDEPAVASSVAVDYIPTPAWLAYAYVERKLSRATSDDIICEPCCGDGAILREIPPHLRAFGIELDPTLAAEARATSGREVLVGDVLAIEIPHLITKVIGNPPFSVPWLNAFLDRFHGIMPEGGEIHLLLPAFAMQTSARVARYHRRYSIETEMIPRDVFPGFDKPLSLVSFTKEQHRKLIGLAFYDETAEWRAMPEEFRRILHRSKTNVWVAAILRALQKLGGRGTVDQIARVISGFRPTQTQHWREAIRKHLRLYFESVERAVYQIPRSLLTVP